MKRKSLFALSAVVIVAAAALVPVLWSGGDNLHNGTAAAATPADQAALVKKGEYLARPGRCLAFHPVRGRQPFAGRLPAAPPFAAARMASRASATAAGVTRRSTRWAAR